MQKGKARSNRKNKNISIYSLVVLCGGLALLSDIPVNVYANAIPTSQLITDEVLDAKSINNSSIENIKFLPYSGVGGSDYATIPYDDLTGNGVTKQMVDETLSNPEFYRQVNELNEKGVPLPPLKTLIALFLISGMGIASVVSKYGTKAIGENLLSYFNSVTTSKPVSKVIETIKVVKETVWDESISIVKKLIKTPKLVAYNAVKEEKTITYKTETWEELEVRPVHINPISRLEMLAEFATKTFEAHKICCESSFIKNAKYYFGGENFDSLEKDYELLTSGAIVSYSKKATQIHEKIDREGSNLRFGIEKMLSSIERNHPDLYAKLNAQYKEILSPTETVMVQKSKQVPVVEVKSVPYTEYRNEYDESYEDIKVITRTPRIIEKEVVEKSIVNEVVTETLYSLNEEKAGVALSYMKSLNLINSGNANNKIYNTFSLWAGDSEFRSNFEKKLKTIAQNIKRNYLDNRDNSEEIANYNALINKMKTLVVNVKNSKNPYEELLGKEYTMEMENCEQILQNSLNEVKQIQEKKDLLSMLVLTKQISAGEEKNRYEKIKVDLRQAENRVKNYKEKIATLNAEASYRFSTTIDTIEALAFVKDYDDYAAKVYNSTDYGTVQLTSVANQPTTVASLTTAKLSTANASTKTYPAVLQAQTLAYDQKDIVKTTSGADAISMSAIAEIIVKEGLNFREFPETGKVISAFPAGSKVEVLGVQNAGSWLFVKNEKGQTGWICGENQYVNFSPVATAKVLVSEGLNFRSSPVDGKIIKALVAGEKMEVLGTQKNGSWLFVRNSQGKTGWVCGAEQYISITKTNSSENLVNNTLAALKNSVSATINYVKNILGSSSSSTKTSPFGTVKEGPVTGVKWGINWDQESLRESCVIGARALVNAFPDFYNGSTIPTMGSFEGFYVGAAKMMTNGTYKGQTFNEMNIPGFEKTYLKAGQKFAPPIGAVVVWEPTPNNSYGHVGVVVGYNDQNEPLILDTNVKSDGNGKMLAYIHKAVNPGSIIGWMTPKEN